MKSLRKLWRRLRGEEVHTSPSLVQPTGQQTEPLTRESPHYTYSAACYNSWWTGGVFLPPYTTSVTPPPEPPPPEPPPAPKTFRAPIAGVETKRSILRDE